MCLDSCHARYEFGACKLAPEPGLVVHVRVPYTEAWDLSSMCTYREDRRGKRDFQLFPCKQLSGLARQQANVWQCKQGP